MNWVSFQEQKWIIGVLFTVPVYACESVSIACCSPYLALGNSLFCIMWGAVFILFTQKCTHSLPLWSE